MRRSQAVAVLLIDVINAFDFRGAGPLIKAAKAAAPRIHSLVTRARDARVPVIYVNDNFGHWASDFRATVTECTRPDRPGREVADKLHPREGDYFVLKPQHSGFYGTPLDLLLDHLHVGTLVLTGFATDLCVMFTAHDAHMRGYHLVVPRDCVGANSPTISRATLAHLRTALGGLTPAASAVDFRALARKARKPRGQTF
jgi:nicotinamidase-related amidase